MKTKKLFFAAAALMVLTACSSDNQSTEPIEERVPVTLAYSHLDVSETRAAQNLNEGTFASGEDVTVRISNTGAGEWTDYDFTTGDAGAMNPASTVPYYPVGAQNIDIVAYYPATAGTSFTVAANQTTDEGYKASDLMSASVTNQAKQAEAVNLSFSHKMAKLCVNVTAGSGVTSIISVSLPHIIRSVDFNPATGEVSSNNILSGNVYMSNNGAALIPPQTITGPLLSIITDKGVATYSVPNGKEFLAGHVYTLNLTVTLLSVGATNAITSWNTDGGTITDDINLNPISVDSKAVDLGFPRSQNYPNGLYWAKMNIGAQYETDYGTYFAWGETTGYTVVGSTTDAAEGNTKTTFTWDTYSLCSFSPDVSFHKYNSDENHGTVDNSTVLLPADDAARANWGDGWRMPRFEEISWLINNCTWTWTTRNNVTGYLVTSNIAGYTNNSIFIPAAGYINGTDLLLNGNSYYWTSSLISPISTDDPTYARALAFGSDNHTDIASERFLGHLVRAVYVPQ